MSGVSDTPVIECRDVTRTFRIGKGLFGEKKLLRAVDGVSFSVQRGEVFAIVGESGCGKTTLAKMVLNLLAPSGGEILIDGVSTTAVDRKEVARRIQPVFQDPYSSLNPRKTVGQIVSLPLDVHKVGTPAERTERVAEMLSMVGLPRRVLHAYPSQLSGGQRQRVAIARALVMRPEIVICDEPTSALDVSVQAQILNLLMDLRETLNLTYVFISHDLGVVEHMSDRVAVMYMGRLAELSEAERLFHDPKHPYTKTLLNAVLSPDPSRGLPDLALNAGFPDPMNPPAGCRFHPRCQDALPQCSSDVPPPRQGPDGLVACHLYERETV